MFKQLLNKIFGKNEGSDTEKKAPNKKESSNGTVTNGGKRVTGKVKFLNKRNGYGFIKSEETEQDVFVHFDDANDFLKRGDTVTFLVEKSEKGLRAREVEVVK